MYVYYLGTYELSEIKGSTSTLKTTFEIVKSV